MHLQFYILGVKRLKEGKPHEVIPVGMSENKMIFENALCKELISQSADAGTGINDDDIIALCSDFEASGISTILQVIFP